jgi:SAM-dependent methyltransferase
MTPATRYDAHVDWYETFRPSLNEDEVDFLRRFLGSGPGRCLDLGCGSGVAIPELERLGWTVTGIDLSEEMLGRARCRAPHAELICGSAYALPLADASFNAVVSIWTHTDIDDFQALVCEVSRVLRPASPFVYIGAHPCFVGPHSRFIAAEGIPGLHPGYRQTGRYDGGPAIGPEGLRAKVGATHLPLGLFVQAFLDAGFELERFEELGTREYPYAVALQSRRSETAPDR